MSNSITIENKINSFNKVIKVPGDKSISIRWALMASQAIGKSRAYNLLNSEDLKSTTRALKKLGIKISFKKDFCEIVGAGLNGFKIKKGTIIDAGNSGTLARLILALLVKSENYVKIVGDKSLSRRDFSRVIKPLKEIGVNILSNNGKLPLKIKGSNFLRPITYNEKLGSAQCKSCVMLAALNIRGKTIIKARKSRNHTEIFFSNLNLPMKIKKNKKHDYIEIKGNSNFRSINYIIPGDISASSFFIVLTLLSENSEILIKNVCVNESRTGIINILNKMNANIKMINKKKYKGEPVSDILVKSTKVLKSINCPISMNSKSIDEFLIIFLAAAKAKGVSNFKDLGELNHKESPRLEIAKKILRLIGIKYKNIKNDIIIYGNPKLKLDKKIEIKNFFKDHRVFMTSCIAALAFGGKWKIHDKDSINSSFPNFLSIIRFMGGKVKNND